ncbi:MAG: preprotein translocase subunit SecG [Clostridia bacterium]|nr:preprotein translocase subunit SecG [Clostridia bacterium]
MTVLKFILGIVFMLISIGLVILILMQRSKEEGLSGAITGQRTESFYSKSGGSLSKEKFLMRLTIVLGVAFAVIAIVLSALMRYGV